MDYRPYSKYVSAMPVTFEWLDHDRTIALTILSEDWSWKEFNAVSRQYKHDLEGIDHPVFEIVMFAGSHKYWLPPNALSYGRNLVQAQPENVVMTVLVTTNNFIIGMTGIFTRLFGHSYRLEVAHNIDEARAIIAVAKQYVQEASR